MIHQGHAYLYMGERFLAMESASRGFVLVRRITLKQGGAVVHSCSYGSAA